MKKLLALLLRPPVPQIAGLVLLCAVVFYGGRALRDWLRLPDRTLLLLCAAVWVVAALVLVWRRVQANRRARLIEDRLRGEAREHREAARPDRRNQIEELERQLGAALTSLKSSKLGKSALYALPWYVIIGPPGSGKTTLLRESGLSFPQMSDGRGLRGVGGTRNCDWWFTNEGILLDTAGRYTTQDEDRDEWLAFLDMLKKSRSKKPINGAMIAISIADLIQADDEQLAEHARKIRERLSELTARLEVVFPVYLLFSKCDLIDGFVEMFGGYGKKERAQVWGFTLPYLQKRGASVAAQFDREFDALHARLCAERLQTLGTTKAQRRKAKIFSFPLQFALAKERLHAFLTQLDQPNPYHESSDIRGFYFTSGTQEGQPLDQVLRNMREAAGLAQADDEQAEEAIEKKAYFIEDLFTEIIFPDRELAHSSAKAEHRRRLLHRVGVIATAAVTFVLAVTLIVGYAQQSNLIDRSIKVCAAAAAFDPTSPAAFDDEERLAAADGGPFEQLRQLFEELDGAYGSARSYVVGQTNNLYEQRVRPLYVEKLRRTFLEPLQDQLLRDLNAAIDAKSAGIDVKTTADRLTAYRMLGGDLLLNRTWLGDDFLKRPDVWTWRKGASIAACRLHRETFVQRVAGTTFRDWIYLPDDTRIPLAEKLVRKEDILLNRLQDVLEEQGQAGTTSWREILKDSPQADLLDDSVGVTTAFVNDAPIDDILDQRGELLGENGGEALRRTKQTAEINEWRQQLARLRPRRKPILTDAMADVAKLTAAEGSPYVEVYGTVLDRLDRLGLKVSKPETAWLKSLLESIHGLETEVDGLCSGTDHLARIVPAAKAGTSGALHKLVQALKRTRTDIEKATYAYADPELKDAMKDALMGLVDTLQYALAQEIVAEGNKVWAAGLGRQLLAFGQRYPFRHDSPDNVDPGRFNAVFKRGGEFDAERTWIDYLAGSVLQSIGFAAQTEPFEADLAEVVRLQRALFATDAAGCEIEFVLQKRGQSSEARFELGEQSLVAKTTVRLSSVWRPADRAAIAIEDYVISGGPHDARIEFRDYWGFLRLLDAGTTGTEKIKDATYQFCMWSDFKDDKNNSLLANDKERAEAKLYFRTEATPNPLVAGFFAHTFAEEVFRARER